MAPKITLTSLENASILRKFTILYFLMSIIPVGVLYFYYLEVLEKGRLEITEQNFQLTMFFVMLAVTIGYVMMRSLLKGVINVTQANKETLESLLGPSAMQSISAENNNEVVLLAKSFNEITSRLEENVRNLELAKKTLHSVLSRVGEGISSMENIDNFLNLILETVTDALQGKSGVLLTLDDKRQELHVAAVYGKKFEGRRQFRFEPDGVFAELFKLKKPVIWSRMPRESGLAGLLEAPMLCAPLVLHDTVSGIIAVCGRNSEAPFDTEEMNLLYNLALQTAVAIENSKLNEDAERTYFETISALALAVEAKDPYSRGHLDRVATYVIKLAQELGLSAQDISLLRDGARLHDLGKIGVTDKVLTKEGPLTAQEMMMMKKHCEIGEGIIKPIRSLRPLCDIVRHHHEKLDGSGYPDGLKGDQIHILVRILTVADIYDALTTNRPYRKSFTQPQAFEQLRNMKDQIDQRLVELLIKIVS